MNKQKGLFVTIDGPNGSGKSTIVDAVVEQITKRGYDILKTKEPTASSLGDFIRNAEEQYRGLTLAFLVAADRQFHVESEILPAVANSKIVISDRYIESSLVLQRLDGLTLETVWFLNGNFPIPDLSVILTASHQTLDRRLADRARRSRFENTKSREEELALYLEAAEFLKKRGFNILMIENDTTDLERNAEKITKMILSLIPR